MVLLTVAERVLALSSMFMFSLGFKNRDAAKVPTTAIPPITAAAAPEAAPNVTRVPTLIRKGTTCGIRSNPQ